MCGQMAIREDTVTGQTRTRNSISESLEIYKDFPGKRRECLSLLLVRSHCMVRGGCRRLAIKVESTEIVQTRSKSKSNCGEW